MSITAKQDVTRAGSPPTPKDIPPKWFYDDRGSELFDEITRLPEYYPTRRERAILDARAGEIVARRGADTLVELGSGTSEKTRLLLDALRDAGTLTRFVPFDVSKQTLHDAAAAIEQEYPGVDVQPVVGDFTLDLDTIPRRGRRLVAFLGGTIGNLLPDAARRVPARHRRDARSRRPPPARHRPRQGRRPARGRVRRRQGVTAEFNKNVLHVMNRELDADFDVDAFEHVAVCDAEQRVDRDAPALDAARRPCASTRSSSTSRSRGRGDAHRGQRQVPRAQASSTSSRPPGCELVDGGPIPTATSRSRSRRPA